METTLKVAKNKNKKIGQGFRYARRGRFFGEDDFRWGEDNDDGVSVTLPSTSTLARFLCFLPHEDDDDDDKSGAAGGREHGRDDPANAARPFLTVFHPKLSLFSHFPHERTLVVVYFPGAPLSNSNLA
jgi:hypothetical protein